MCDHNPPEPAMAIIADGIWCDPCLAPLIRALNEGGIPTIASCCGHSKRLGSITLTDGRWLVIAPDTATVTRLANHPTGIAGVAMGDHLANGGIVKPNAYPLVGGDCVFPLTDHLATELAAAKTATKMAMCSAAAIGISVGDERPPQLVCAEPAGHPPPHRTADGTEWRPAAKTAAAEAAKEETL